MPRPEKPARAKATLSGKDERDTPQYKAALARLNSDFPDTKTTAKTIQGVERAIALATVKVERARAAAAAAQAEAQRAMAAAERAQADLRQAEHELAARQDQAARQVSRRMTRSRARARAQAVAERGDRDHRLPAPTQAGMAEPPAPAAPLADPLPEPPAGPALPAVPAEAQAAPPPPPPHNEEVHAQLIDGADGEAPAEVAPLRRTGRARKPSAKARENIEHAPSKAAKANARTRSQPPPDGHRERGQTKGVPRRSGKSKGKGKLPPVERFPAQPQAPQRSEPVDEVVVDGEPQEPSAELAVAARDASEGSPAAQLSQPDQDPIPSNDAATHNLSLLQAAAQVIEGSADTQGATGHPGLLPSAKESAQTRFDEHTASTGSSSSAPQAADQDRAAPSAVVFGSPSVRTRNAAQALMDFSIPPSHSVRTRDAAQALIEFSIPQDPIASRPKRAIEDVVRALTSGSPCNSRRAAVALAYMRHGQAPSSPEESEVVNETGSLETVDAQQLQPSISQGIGNASDSQEAIVGPSRASAPRPFVLDLEPRETSVAGPANEVSASGELTMDDLTGATAEGGNCSGQSASVEGTNDQARLLGHPVSDERQTQLSAGDNNPHQTANNSHQPRQGPAGLPISPALSDQPVLSPILSPKRKISDETSEDRTHAEHNSPHKRQRMDATPATAGPSGTTEALPTSNGGQIVATPNDGAPPGSASQAEAPTSSARLEEDSVDPQQQSLGLALVVPELPSQAPRQATPPPTMPQVNVIPPTAPPTPSPPRPAAVQKRSRADDSYDDYLTEIRPKDTTKVVTGPCCEGRMSSPTKRQRTL